MGTGRGQASELLEVASCITALKHQAMPKSGGMGCPGAAAPDCDSMWTAMDTLGTVNV